MRCFLEQEVGRFAARVQPFLARRPIEHNVLLTMLDPRSASRLPAEPLLAWLGDGAGEVRGVAIRTPPRNLLLSRMPRSALEVLADALAHQESLPGVAGPQPEASIFAELWARRAGQTAMRGMAQRLYRLERVTPPRGVPGRPRAARPAEIEVLAGWARAFAAEAGVEGPDPRGLVEHLVRGGRLRVWDNEAPVSMCALSPPIAGVVRVSLVYTPPERRRRGYASACVAAASQQALAREARSCALYTDLANPTSSAIYRAIGYAPVVDAQVYTFGQHASAAPREATGGVS